MFENGSYIGPYIVRQKLGSGVTGTVFYGWHPEENVPVAIKVLEAHLSKDDGVRTMFDEEARAGLSIESPHVVKTLSAGEEKGFPYIAFEYIHGVPLEELIKNGPISESNCVWVLRQIATGLRELRKKGIVHQDIKPDNILIEKNGTCKLTDLGFARITGGKIKWDGYSAGTAFYMSPEQCSPNSGIPIDWRADLYALGASIYHAATGQPPFVSDDEDEVFNMQVHSAPIPAVEKNVKLSDYFSNVLDRLLEKNPLDRFQTPEELLLEIRNLPIPPKAPEVTIPDRH